jgi:hypothetical protein
VRSEFWPDISGVVSENGRVDIEESATISPLNPPARVAKKTVCRFTRKRCIRARVDYAQTARAREIARCMRQRSRIRIRKREKFSTPAACCKTRFHIVGRDESKPSRVVA